MDVETALAVHEAVKGAVSDAIATSTDPLWQKLDALELQTKAGGEAVREFACLAAVLTSPAEELSLAERGLLDKVRERIREILGREVKTLPAPSPPAVSATGCMKLVGSWLGPAMVYAIIFLIYQMFLAPKP